MTAADLPGSATRGVWTRDQALAVVSPGDLRSLLRRSTQTVWPGVYADAADELDAEQRAIAAVLASGGADQPVPFGDPDPVTSLQRRRLRAVAVRRTAARVYG